MKPLVSSPRFSQELFWDTRLADIDFVRNKRWVVVRVLEHGRMEDWTALLRLYSLQEIVACAKQARSLDDKAFAFIRFVSGEPKEEFRCFTTKPSQRQR